MFIKKKVAEQYLFLNKGLCDFGFLEPEATSCLKREGGGDPQSSSHIKSMTRTQRCGGLGRDSKMVGQSLVCDLL